MSVLCRIVARCLCGIHVVVFWIGVFVHCCCVVGVVVVIFIVFVPSEVFIYYAVLIILRECLPRFSPVVFKNVLASCSSSTPV